MYIRKSLTSFSNCISTNNLERLTNRQNCQAQYTRLRTLFTTQIMIIHPVTEHALLIATSSSYDLVWREGRVAATGTPIRRVRISLPRLIGANTSCITIQYCVRLISWLTALYILFDLYTTINTEFSSFLNINKYCWLLGIRKLIVLPTHNNNDCGILGTYNLYK